MHRIRQDPLLQNGKIEQLPAKILAKTQTNITSARFEYGADFQIIMTSSVINQSRSGTDK